MRHLASFMLFLFSASLVHASDSNAWWIICNTCASEADFRLAAQEAPIDGFVFVSNGESGESRKFERLTLIEDAPGSIIVTVVISDVPLPPAQASVLTETLASARTILVGMPRDSVPGLNPVGSVVGDVSNGQLRAGFMTFLMFELHRAGYFPDSQSVGSELGLNLWGIAVRGHQASNQVRQKPLWVSVVYPDGSRVVIAFSEDAKDIVSVEITDAEDNPLPLLGRNWDGGIGLDREGFMGREFAFGDPVNELLNWLNGAAGGGAMECRAEVTEDGVRVICRQP